MKILLTFLTIALIFSETALASGGLFRRNINTGYHYQPQYYHYPVVVQEKYVIPIREIKFNEVKGFKILETIDGQKYYEINGKLFAASKDGAIYNPEIKHKIEKDKIIIERTITQY